MQMNVVTISERRSHDAPPPPPPSEDQPLPGWKDLLHINQNGRYLADELNLRIALRFAPELSGMLHWDTRWLRVICKQRPPFVTAPPPPFPWGDQHDCDLAAYLIFNNFARPPERLLARCVYTTALARPFDEVLDYLDSVTWDKKPRIDTWLVDYLGVTDSLYSRAAGAKWLVAACRRALEPGIKFDDLLILEGRQGLRKSMLLETLAGPKFFTNNMAQWGTRDGTDQSHGPWIIEVQEFDRVLKGSGASKAKAHLSTAVDFYRAAYTRHKRVAPRDGVFVATTNEQEYLPDSTNRRYHPVWCTLADVEGIAAVRDQLWAEATLRAKEKGQIYFSPEEEVLAVVEQKHRQETHPYEEIILPYLERKNSVSLGEFFAPGGPLVDKGRTSRSEATLVRILRAEGWLKRRPAGKGPRARRYYAPGPLDPWTTWTEPGEHHRRTGQ